MPAAAAPYVPSRLVSAPLTLTLDRASRSARLTGTLDVRTAGHLRKGMSALVSSGAGDVKLFLGDLRFLDAAGMGAFVAVNNRLAGSGARLRLEDVSPWHTRLLTVGGLSWLIADAGFGI